MSGHSKWANIKHRKGRQDAKKAKIYTKIGKEIVIAVKQGGSDPDVNARLKMAIQKARANNMPMDNITRNIQKASGELEGVNYEEFPYEGYGPGGAAVMLDIMTDNRNRTAGEVRHLFSKYGGNLGESGCVAWMFDKKGLIMIDKEDLKADPDDVMMTALEAGAEDMKDEGDSIEVTCAPEEFEAVETALREAGFPVTVAEITMVPQTTVALEGSEAEKMLKLMDALEDHDDVQNVYSNFDIDDEMME
ncbi:YebC/PmpR family DNA-binding transcriptional regulator [Phosphitispora fastidiosa]|uniref:YebC/PmpR family DNA-binding transcriptional regulator n=1 Tax=Phosphitispora fastidiosa TaxID=2837202 RepID=UPI001E631AE8|nr:YebC/PmpR family DNA-binding transcriptional regulator [Phosphitispora fastidiosa]MBU7007857.1 YebC/PmpR family DNA-binding regulatory protein [Phosphitispora fastidiosa]